MFYISTTGLGWLIAFIVVVIVAALVVLGVFLVNHFRSDEEKAERLAKKMEKKKANEPVEQKVVVKKEEKPTLTKEEKEEIKKNKHQSKLVRLSNMGKEASLNVNVEEDQNGRLAVGIIYNEKSKVYMFGPKDFELNVGDVVTVKDASDVLRTVPVVMPNKMIPNSLIVEPFKDIEDVLYRADGKMPEKKEEKAPEPVEEVKEEPVQEEAPVEEPVQEEAPVEEPVQEETPVEEPAQEETPVEEPAQEETPAEEPAQEEAPAEEPVQEETPVEEPAQEEAPAEEPAQEETPAEEPAQEEPAEEESDDEEDEEESDDEDEAKPQTEEVVDKDTTVEFDVVNKKYKITKIKRTYQSKLHQATDELKKYYSDIKNALLSYGLSSRESKTGEKFRNKKNNLAQIKFAGKQVALYLAIKPETLADSKYKGKDVSSKKAYEATPFQYKFKTGRKAVWAKELVEKLAQENNLVKDENYKEEDFAKKYETLTEEELIEKGLIVKTVVITDVPPKGFHKVEEVTE